jgi:hypothetical protein
MCPACMTGVLIAIAKASGAGGLSVMLVKRAVAMKCRGRRSPAASPDAATTRDDAGA